MVGTEFVETLTAHAMTAADWVGRSFWRQFGIRSHRSPYLYPPQLIAHRGAWNVSSQIENTVPAFQSAFDAGCWGVELDVRALKDRTLIVHHDNSLARTFGRHLKLSQISFAHLRHEVPQVPTLREVVSAIGSRGHLMLELKTDGVEWDDRLVRSLMDELASLTCVEDYHFMSLDLDFLRRLEAYHPPLRSGLVAIATTNVRRASAAVEQRNWAALTAHWLMLNAATIARHHRLKQRCGTGFAESRECLLRESSRDIDWIFTNHGHHAPSWLNGGEVPR